MSSNHAADQELEDADKTLVIRDVHDPYQHPFPVRSLPPAALMMTHLNPHSSRLFHTIIECKSDDENGQGAEFGYLLIPV